MTLPEAGGKKGKQMDNTNDESIHVLQARLEQWRTRLKNLTGQIDNLRKEQAQVEKVINELEEKIAGRKASLGDEEEDSDENSQETSEHSLPAVLVVDDVTVIRMSLRRVLESSGYVVEEADDGSTALEILQEKTVDLVIADINMKYMDGLEMVERIRGNTKTADLPVLMCTISNQKKEVLRAIRLGVQGFLIKPVKPQVVLEKVNEILSSENEKSSEVHEPPEFNVEATVQ